MQLHCLLVSITGLYGRHHQALGCDAPGSLLLVSLLIPTFQLLLNSCHKQCLSCMEAVGANHTYKHVIDAYTAGSAELQPHSEYALSFWPFCWYGHIFTSQLRG